MDDQEFDDWFNDASAAENSDAIGNQAAKFDSRETEMRKNDADFTKAAFQMAGQIYARFLTPDGSGKIFKASSGHLVRKDDDNTFIMLTSAHSFVHTMQGEACEFETGLFFLNKNGKSNLASFEFGLDDIKNFEGFEGNTSETLACEGYDIAAVKCTLKKKNGDIPDPVALAEQSKEELPECIQMGYPKESIVEEANRKDGVKLQVEGSTLFYMEGKIEHVIDANETGGAIAAHSMDCSPGQDGGALVNKETGAVLGIFSQVENLADQGDDFYVNTFIDSVIMDWFNGLEW